MANMYHYNSITIKLNSYSSCFLREVNNLMEREIR